MAIIRISNLKLRTIIGIHDWEREHKQDVIINVAITFDAQKASESDCLEDTLDYKAITKHIIQEVESSNYYLLERLAKNVLNIVLEYPKVQEATVRVDKPFALRFADSVSVEMSEAQTS